MTYAKISKGPGIKKSMFPVWKSDYFESNDPRQVTQWVTSSLDSLPVDRAETAKVTIAHHVRNGQIHGFAYIFYLGN